MEQEPKSDSQPELPDYEKASDTEIALFLMHHIDNPCEVEVELGKTENIREFYLCEAESALHKFENPFAVDLLKGKIEEYRKK